LETISDHFDICEFVGHYLATVNRVVIMVG